MTAKVLVVDDILANVRLLEAKLMAEYFEVSTAMNGLDALECVQRIKPDIVLLDVLKTHRTPRVDAVKRALGITDELNIGSVGLKIGLVAENARDLYVYTGGRTKIWDTCGPEAILVAAGGRVTDLDGKPLIYATTDLYNRRGIVASNGPLHDHVIAVIAPHVQTKTD